MSFPLNFGQKIQNIMLFIYGIFRGQRKEAVHFMGEINLRRIRYSAKFRVFKGQRGSIGDSWMHKKGK